MGQQNPNAQQNSGDKDNKDSSRQQTQQPNRSQESTEKHNTMKNNPERSGSERADESSDRNKFGDIQKRQSDMDKE